MIGYVIIGFLGGAGTHYIYVDVQRKIQQNKRKRRQTQKHKTASTLFR